MEPKEIEMLRVLVEDARRSYREIAKEVHTSIATVSTHVKRMERDEVILGYTAVVDPAKVGYDLTAVIGVRISKGKLMEVQRKVASSENVFAVYDVTGEWDSIVLARFRSRKELDGFIKMFQAMEHVERTYTYMVLNIVKEDLRVRA
jgi:DNA-binding Lrp family transcriptional regulator